MSAPSEKGKTEETGAIRSGGTRGMVAKVTGGQGGEGLLHRALSMNQRHPFNMVTWMFSPSRQYLHTEMNMK